jgi:hypothetical protein
MKKFIVPLVAFATLALGSAAAPVAAGAQTLDSPASPAIVAFYGHHEFRVQFRRFPHQAFRNAGTFRFYDAARHEADRLDSRGFQTRILNVW